MCVTVSGLPYFFMHSIISSDPTSQVCKSLFVGLTRHYILNKYLSAWSESPPVKGGAVNQLSLLTNHTLFISLRYLYSVIHFSIHVFISSCFHIYLILAKSFCFHRQLRRCGYTFKPKAAGSWRDRDKPSHYLVWQRGRILIPSPILSFGIK